MIRFGIPSLDRLLGHPHARDDGERPYGIDVEGRTTTICIVGTGGTGKSELALHLASRYVADARAGSEHTSAQVFYVSTDLSHGTADSIWQRFSLNAPNARWNPPDHGTPYPENDLKVSLTNRKVLSVDIQDRPPLPATGREDTEVSFFDLHRSSHQDEWGALIALAEDLASKPPGPKHLLIIDSAEGLDTLVATSDQGKGVANGRARIKGLLARVKDRCHIVFVLEESAQGEACDEETVSDVVVRLREVEVKGYQRRTVAIEKLRGQPYVRGQHPIKFRSGRGSQTRARATSGQRSCVANHDERYLQNHDDPEVVCGGHSPSVQSERCTPIHQSYVQVYRSLHALNRFWTEDRFWEKSKHTPLTYAQFGIENLDGLLAHRGDDKEVGLCRGSVAALIGEPGTHKVHIWRAFLKEAFAPLREHLEKAKESANRDIADLLRDHLNKSERERIGTPLDCALDECEAAVLVTTSDTDAWDLAERFAELLLPSGTPRREEAVAALVSLILPKTVCRRLELHDLPAPVLLSIVTSAVEPSPEAKHVWDAKTRVRLVLGDLRIWREIYFDLQREPFFLPVLLFQLRRKHVTTLVVDGSLGQPENPAGAQAETELRSLADPRLHVWRVPFYGDSRVAIAVIPPPSGDPIAPIGRVLVRELRCEDDDGVERPVVDAHFELYKGIESGRPEPIHLEICMFSETPQVQSYIDAENRFLEGIFKPFQATGVIRPVAMDDYKTLRDWTRGQPETQLDHTRLLQVDEFWLPSRKTCLRPQTAYLRAPTSDDPYGLHPHRTADETKPRRRFQSFQRTLGYGLDVQEPDSKTDPKAAPKTDPKADAKIDSKIDRIPLTWDFGFLLCKVEPWRDHEAVSIPSLFGYKAPLGSVGEIWKGLPQAWGRADESWGQGKAPDEPQPSPAGGGSRKSNGSKKPRPRPSWRAFLGACDAITRASTTKSPSRYTAFDVCLLSSESFSCFILEVWMSEVSIIVRSMQNGAERKAFDTWLKSLATRSWAPLPGARRLFDEPDSASCDVSSRAFLRTWLLLADVLDLERFASPSQPFQPVSRDANTTAVATRYWYKMACTAQQRDPATVTVAAGLPGSFSTRGDWFLGVAHESRSWRLADRALDFLSSRRANFERMQLGIGLPTRTIEDEQKTAVRTFLKGPVEERSHHPQKITQNSMMNVSYAAVQALGAPGSDGQFFWLWRSSFKDYDRLNAIWQKSLVRLVIAWQDFKREHQHDMVSCFDMYDVLARYGDEPLTKEWWDGPDKRELQEALEKKMSSDTTSKDKAAAEAYLDRLKAQLLEAWSRLQNSIRMIRQLFGK